MTTPTPPRDPPARPPIQLRPAPAQPRLGSRPPGSAPPPWLSGGPARNRLGAGWPRRRSGAVLPWVRQRPDPAPPSPASTPACPSVGFAQPVPLRRDTDLAHTGLVWKQPRPGNNPAPTVPRPGSLPRHRSAQCCPGLAPPWAGTARPVRRCYRTVRHHSGSTPAWPSVGSAQRRPGPLPARPNTDPAWNQSGVGRSLAWPGSGLAECRPAPTPLRLCPVWASSSTDSTLHDSTPASGVPGIDLPRHCPRPGTGRFSADLAQRSMLCSAPAGSAPGRLGSAWTELAATVGARRGWFATQDPAAVWIGAAGDRVRPSGVAASEPGRAAAKVEKRGYRVGGWPGTC
jgi:hypothetical protein